MWRKIMAILNYFWAGLWRGRKGMNHVGAAQRGTRYQLREGVEAPARSFIGLWPSPMLNPARLLWNRGSLKKYWKVFTPLRSEIHEAPAPPRNPPFLDRGNNRLKIKKASVFHLGSRKGSRNASGWLTEVCLKPEMPSSQSSDSEWGKKTCGGKSHSNVQGSKVV